jgi:hypothetical protein
VRNQTVTAFSFSFWAARKYLKSNYCLELPAFNHDDAPLSSNSEQLMMASLGSMAIGMEFTSQTNEIDDCTI